METFKKLKSGNWNLVKYDYTDELGKRHYKSFTAPTKAEIRRMVAKWTDTRTKRPASVLVLSEAFSGYFELKRSVLSPSTLRGYEGIKKNYIDPHNIGRLPVNKLNNQIIQAWVSWLAAQHSPKTTRNAYGLLSAVLGVYAPDMRLAITLPQKEKQPIRCPNESEIQAVLSEIRAAKDRNLEISVLLGAFVPARRSEIAALTYADIEGNVININKAMVHSANNEWITKTTKTTESTRSVEVPAFVVDLIGKGKPEERIVPVTPNYITDKFRDYVQASGVQPFRFHDLRHYGASILLTVMSSRYVQDRGGWSSPYTMNRVYNNIIDLEKARQTKKALEMFNQFNVNL